MSIKVKYPSYPHLHPVELIFYFIHFFLKFELFAENIRKQNSFKSTTKVEEVKKPFG